MTATVPTAASLADHALIAAEALRDAITGSEGWTVEPTAGPLHADGWRMVQTNLGDVTLALACDAGLARHLQVGPPPAEDLLEGGQRVLRAAADVLGAVAGTDAMGDVVEVPALPAGPGRDVLAMSIVADGHHRATLVAAVPAAPSEDEPPGADFSTPLVPEPSRAPALPTGLELLHDVEMGVTAELGRTRMLVRDVLELTPGSVVELDRAAGSPVDILVNGTLIARGEVVVIDEEFGVRITEVLGYVEDRGR